MSYLIYLSIVKGYKKTGWFLIRFMLALPIFPARLQASIVGRNELNFRVRNGNGWTLILISTNYFLSPERKWSKKIFIFLSSLSLNRIHFNLLFSLCQVLFWNFSKKLVTRTGIEPMFAAWEAAVLTAWPTGLMVRLQGFEPGTHWLRVSCSTNWAKGAYRIALNLHPENRTVNLCNLLPSKRLHFP